MNRKGSAQDVILLGALLFAFGLGFFIINYMVGTTVDKMVATPQVNSSQTAVEALQGIKTNVTDRLDYVVFGILIGMTLAIIITGWFIGGNPLFMVLYFLVVVMAVVAGAVLSNAWESFTQRPLLAPTLVHFPITNHIMLYLPYYVAVIGIVGMTVMFAKPYISDGKSGGLGLEGGHL